MDCQWCGSKAKETVLIEMDKYNKYQVCRKCSEEYLRGDFDAIKDKIRKLKR